MTKRNLIKYIINEHHGKRVFFQNHDVEFTANGLDFAVKILPVTNNTLVNVNSTIMWELKKGKAEGPRFIASSKTLVDVKEFAKKKHKIIMFQNKPYKVLKALNEADLLDISDQNEVHGFYFISDPSELHKIIKLSTNKE